MNPRVFPPLALAVFTFSGCGNGEKEAVSNKERKLEEAALSNHLDDDEDHVLDLVLLPAGGETTRKYRFKSARLGFTLSDGWELCQEFKGRMESALEVLDAKTGDFLTNTSYSAGASVKSNEDEFIALKFRKQSKSEITFAVTLDKTKPYEASQE